MSWWLLWSRDLRWRLATLIAPDLMTVHDDYAAMHRQRIDFLEEKLWPREKAVSLQVRFVEWANQPTAPGDKDQFDAAFDQLARKLK